MKKRSDTQQPKPRGERAQSRHENDEREQQFREASVRRGYVRCGGGYLVRRKKIGGD